MARKSVLIDIVAAPLGRLALLDPLADPLQQLARRLLPETSTLKELTSGTWFGHPVHPPLTDVVVGSWVGAWALDLTHSRGNENAADDLVALGVVAAVPTLVTGLSDWAELQAAPRRIGLVHALANTAAIGLHATSWLARRRGKRRLGRRLSTTGLALAGGAAWLGGHLSFAQGIGVDQTVFVDPPTSWTPVLDMKKLGDRALVRRSARGSAIVLLRQGAQVHALVDRCSHRGCSLSEGTYDGEVVTCHCHGSQFGVDGAVLRGPAVSPQPTLETRVRNGKIEVRAHED